MKAGWLILAVLLSGCSFWTADPVPLPQLARGAATSPSPPPWPAMPEVRYLDPCDPKAVAGLTQEAFHALLQRDRLWQQHVERLEQQIRGMQ